MLTGQLISHYRLLERIGRDHDTVIYRARDLKLGRDVAVKVLSQPETAQATARERFRREAHIASLVTHPHICAVHDSGDENGVAFLVCELLDGRALDESLEGQPLPTDRVIDIGIQLADALAAVHRRGIVHGNIKPSNVFITTEGHVKLLEVGLMSAWWESTAAPDTVHDSTPTASLDRRQPADASVAGFHPYRSPEQVLGERLDHRTDLFSAGAVLYEMAAGAPPFGGDTPSQIGGAIVADSPVTVSVRNPLLADALTAVIERALEKSADERYQSASDLLADLRRARRQLESSSTRAALPPPPRRRSLWHFAVASALALILLAGAARWLWGRYSVPARRHSVLVGSVANGTNDPDFDGTLREALVVHLGQSPYLDIVSDERVRQTLQLMSRPADATLTHEIAREVCLRLGLGAMIEGSVSAVGRVTVVALVATDCVSGDAIARDQVEVVRKEDVLRAVGGIASALRRSLGESVASLEAHNVPIEEATTASLEGLKAYTAGVAKRSAGAEIESIQFFERAIALDGRFALAYTMLSTVYGSLGEISRSEKYARLAHEHRESVSERERLFITYQYHDRVTGDQLKAREALDVWKQSYPRDYRPANALAVLLNRLGDYDRAILEAEEAIRRNPDHPFPHSNLAYALRGAGRYAEAREAAERAVTVGIDSMPTRRLLYQLAELENDTAAAGRHVAWALPRASGFDLTGAQAQVAAFRGRMQAARTLYRQTVTLAERNGFPEIALGYMAQAALTEALFGNRAAAIEQARGIPEKTTYAPRLRAATALALAGAAGEAQAIARSMRGFRPDDTLLHTAYIPILEAALHLESRRPDAAIESLRRAAPCERGSVAVLLPIYIRGLARFEARAYADAVQQFQAVLDGRGADPFSPLIPMAYLGLGRSLALNGDPAGSRKAYEQLLALWREADADFPPLRQLRRLAALN